MYHDMLIYQYIVASLEGDEVTSDEAEDPDMSEGTLVPISEVAAVLVENGQQCLECNS